MKQKQTFHLTINKGMNRQSNKTRLCCIFFRSSRFYYSLLFFHFSIISMYIYSQLQKTLQKIEWMNVSQSFTNHKVKKLSLCLQKYRLKQKEILNEEANIKINF